MRISDWSSDVCSSDLLVSSCCTQQLVLDDAIHIEEDDQTNSERETHDVDADAKNSPWLQVLLQCAFLIEHALVGAHISHVVVSIPRSCELAVAYRRHRVCEVGEHKMGRAHVWKR